MKKKRKRKVEIFISFIEEGIMNPQYWGYVGGRIEVSKPDDSFTTEEIRFFTKNTEEYYKFRDEWDMKEITKTKLEEIRKTVEEKFYDLE